MTKNVFKNWIRLTVLKGMRLSMLTVLIAGIAGAVYSTEVVERIVAVVNDDIIVLSDLKRELAPGMESIKTQGLTPEEENEEIKKYREIMLNQLINQKLIDQEIKRYGITVTDEDIDKSIIELRENKGLTEAQFEEEMNKNLGLSMAEYREKVKEQLLRMKLINSQVQSKIVITDKERQMFYERYEEEYGDSKSYHLRNIIMMVTPETSESEKQERRKKMEEILEKLREGAAFEKMANEYSEASTNGEGGDLGFFRFNDLSQQLQEALLGIGEGEFTQILDTDMGYQILYVDKIENKSGKSLEEASPDIDQKLYNASVNMKFQSWLMELRERSHIKIIE